MKNTIIIKDDSILIEEWDYEKNVLGPESFSAFSHKKVNWICSRNTDHRWEARISDRSKGSDCPFCVGKKVWWVCMENQQHIWAAPLSNRINMKTGCPKCSNHFSNGHKEVVEYIQSFYCGEIKINDRNIIKPRELDIFLPEKNAAIEYNGEYYHSFDEIKERDLQKKSLCEQKQIKLLTIWEQDWKNKKEYIKKEIDRFIG